MTVRIRLKRQKRYSSFLKSGCSCGGFEAVLGKRTKKKSPANPLVYWTFWRRVRDSNPRSLSAYSISSAAPSTTRTTLHMSIRKSFPKLLERTDGKNTNFIQFSNCETPHKHWISCGQNLHCFKKFRVSPVMITSLRLPLSLATR